MQSHPLNIGGIIDHAAARHGSREVVAREPDGTMHRSDWRQIRERAGRIANAVAAMGLVPGDRVATLAWNRLPHLELYFGVPSAGFVLHTVNPRLHVDHIRFILRHGGARLLCVDPDLLHLIEPIVRDLPAIERVIVLCARRDLPDTPLEDPLAYEEWIAAAAPRQRWPEVMETAASTLCYTSGTTGDPKAVLYSHRSTVLHAMQVCMADSMALSARDAVGLVTPLFHVNAWGVPFAAAICGAKIALPGAALDPGSLLELFSGEGVTFSLGVPTVWLALLDHLRGAGAGAGEGLALTRVLIGGSAPPPSLIEAFGDLGVEVIQAWGMTETSPVMTVSIPLASQVSLGSEEAVRLRSLQGRAVFGAEMRIVDEGGARIEEDGSETGRLQVRGHWVIDRYFGDEGRPATDPEGWFDTGDIAQITRDGFLRLTDRAKDVIKSGGEWISSIDLENAAQSHPDVAEAAVIGARHDRWQERPLMLLVLRDGARFDRNTMIAHLAETVARWWLPDDFVVVDELPHTATGKLLKQALRERYGDYLVIPRRPANNGGD